MLESYADQCAFGLKEHKSMMHIKKPTWFITTSPEISARLQRKCNGKHEHFQTSPNHRKELAAARIWPPKLCSEILEGSTATVRRKDPGRLRRLCRAIDRRLETAKDKLELMENHNVLNG